MRLQRVAIDHIRNLHDVSIDLSAHLNILFGENASGKTSFLESLHMLAYAKSFRSHHFRHIVNHGAHFLRVTGLITETGGDRAVPLGIEYRQGRLKMRADGRNVKKTSELAQHLPIIVIHQECQRLLTGGPKLRRKFLDWGVFHVEQRFLPAWRRYVRALKQRNSVLQAGKGRAAVSVWDQELKENAVAIHAYRRAYCDVLLPVWQQCTRQLLGNGEVLSLSYQAGWDIDQDYSAILAASYEQDARRGFTHHGPHRADLAIRVAGVSAHEHLSRGQQKLLICAMLIAQALVYRQHSQKPCIFLIDDLKAELDDEHVRRVMVLLKDLDAQIIMTATEKGTLEPYCPEGHKTFHVERGQVTDVTEVV